MTTILSQPTLTRLLGSIEADRLLLLCGAGLSMPPPSDLLSAVQVARTCYDKYNAIQPLPFNMRDRIDEIAAHFYASRQFDSVFIDALVPWNELTGEPNAGHAAVADFLICRAAHAVLSANFDTLIEHWAANRKVAMRGALNGSEAMTFREVTNPLVKFHGCMVRGRAETLWTDEQLREPRVSARVGACSDWIKLTIPGKDLLVVGFWTDWGYLNDVLANALNDSALGSVTIVDPAPAEYLRSKAPNLWATLEAATTTFEHIAASGSDALIELRRAFSLSWMKRFYTLAKNIIEEAGLVYSEPDVNLNCDDLYDCRRDIEGVPYNRAARLKAPPVEATQASFFQHLLLRASAARHGAWFELQGKRIRVVQGAGQAVTSIKQRYREPSASTQADIIVCAGAVDLGVPGRIIDSGTGASVVRPAAGGGARWMTVDQARGELGL